MEAEPACVLPEQQPPGTWVQGQGWNADDWGGGLPTKDWIPAACDQHYVYLLWKEGHMAVINGLAGAQSLIHVAVHALR